MNTFGPLGRRFWEAYYRRDKTNIIDHSMEDGPECLRKMGIPTFPCGRCGKDHGCGRRVELGNSSQCKDIRWWMYDYWPMLTEKIKAASSGTNTESGKENNSINILHKKGGIVNGTS